MKNRLIATILLMIMISMLFLGHPVTANGNINFSFNLDTIEINRGSDFTVTIQGMDLTRLYAYEVVVKYDTDKLILKKTQAKLLGNTLPANKLIDSTLYHGCTKIGNEQVQSGDMDLCSLSFEAKSEGNTEVILEEINIIQKKEDGNLEKMTYTMHETLSIQVTVESATPTPETPTPVTPPTLEQPTGTSSPTPTPEQKPITITVAQEGKVPTITTEVEASIDTSTGVSYVDLKANIVQEMLSRINKFASDDKEVLLEIVFLGDSITKVYSMDIAFDTFNNLTNTGRESLKISAGEVNVTFDSNSLKAVKDQYADGDINIHIENVELSNLGEEIRTQVGDRPVYSFSVKSGDSYLTSFNEGHVDVSIPYVPEADEDPESIIVYYIDNTGNLQVVRGGFNKESGKVTFTTGHFSMFAVGYNPVSFVDVLPEAYYNKAVSYLAARHITNGVGDGRFAPMHTITRAELLVLLMNAYGIIPDEAVSDNFSDAGNKYYSIYLGTAKRLGLVNGVGNNQYLPEVSISRQDMFVVLYNILVALGEVPENKGDKTLVDFGDARDVSVYANEAIKALVEAECVQGYNGNLNPKATSTRAEAAQLIYNLLTYHK